MLRYQRDWTDEKKGKQPLHHEDQLHRMVAWGLSYVHKELQFLPFCQLLLYCFVSFFASTICLMFSEIGRWSFCASFPTLARVCQVVLLWSHQKTKLSLFHWNIQNIYIYMLMEEKIIKTRNYQISYSSPVSEGCCGRSNPESFHLSSTSSLQRKTNWRRRKSWCVPEKLSNQILLSTQTSNLNKCIQCGLTHWTLEETQL